MQKLESGPSARPRQPDRSAAPPVGPTVLVTDAGLASALAVIRSLGRKGYRVIAADSDPKSMGFRSRWTHDRLLYPPPESSPREFVPAVRAAVDRYAVDLVIPVTDAAILPLSESRALFRDAGRLALPDAAALEVTTAKNKTLELAARLGIATPRTAVVETVAEAREAARSLGWPVVLKPQVSRLYRDRASVEALEVSYANGPAGLDEQMRRFEGRCPVLLQEYCRGAGCGVELLMDRGRPLAAFQHKRLREVPITGGASSLRESVPLDKRLYEQAVSLLEALEWTGLAMVEFRVEGGSATLMEINGRIWGSLPLAVRSGMDFPARLAELYLQGPPDGRTAPDTSYQIGVRARNLELDLVWIGSVLIGRRKYPYLPLPARHRAIGALLGLANPFCRTDVMMLSDPQPGLAELGRIVRKLRSKLSRRERS